MQCFNALMIVFMDTLMKHPPQQEKQGNQPQTENYSPEHYSEAPKNDNASKPEPNIWEDNLPIPIVI